MTKDIMDSVVGGQFHQAYTGCLPSLSMIAAAFPLSPPNNALKQTQSALTYGRRRGTGRSPARNRANDPTCWMRLFCRWSYSGAAGLPPFTEQKKILER